VKPNCLGHFCGNGETSLKRAADSGEHRVVGTFPHLIYRLPDRGRTRRDIGPNEGERIPQRAHVVAVTRLRRCWMRRSKCENLHLAAPMRPQQTAKLKLPKTTKPLAPQEVSSVWRQDLNVRPPAPESGAGAACRVYHGVICAGTATAAYQFAAVLRVLATASRNLRPARSEITGEGPRGFGRGVAQTPPTTGPAPGESAQGL
jgi:hypothetical protein